MDRLRAGYERLRKNTERVGDRVMKQALNSGVGDVGSKVRHALNPGRQYNICGRTVVEDRQINEGGFAFVWIAHDVKTNEELALKKIVCQDRERFAMARREVALLEKLPQHPNLVRYYGHTVCDTEGRAKEFILLFELCPGGHLLDLLDRNNGQLHEDRILEVLRDLTSAVVLLHAQTPPVQHRDLKVENVLLGSDGSFKLCDFGSWSDQESDIASLDKQEISALQEQIDRYTTMMYRPPEMVDFYQHFTISEKVDMWMLGCILYTLMFCRHPFQDESTLAVSNARYHMPDNCRFSESLQDLTHWLLAKDPVHRPSAQQVLDILEHFTDGVPLPLPRAVAKKRDALRCDHSDPQAAGRSRDNLPTGDSGKSRQQRQHGSSRHNCSRNTGSSRRRIMAEKGQPSNDFWALADSGNQVSAIGNWPPTAAPQPNRAWASFDTQPEGLQDSLASAGIFLSQESWAAAGIFFSQENTATGAVDGITKSGSRPGSRGSLQSAGKLASPWSAWDAPSSGSRAARPDTPPNPRVPASASGWVTGANDCASASWCLADGSENRTRSTEPHKRTAAHEVPASAVRSASSTRKPPHPRASASACSGPGGAGTADFWSLAAASSGEEGNWDPFIQNVRWPTPPKPRTSQRSGFKTTNGPGVWPATVRSFSPAGAKSRPAKLSSAKEAHPGGCGLSFGTSTVKEAAWMQWPAPAGTSAPTTPCGKPPDGWGPTCLVPAATPCRG